MPRSIVYAVGISLMIWVGIFLLIMVMIHDPVMTELGRKVVETGLLSGPIR